ncbi:hypothetical protein ACTGVB_12035, partial [Streptococcus suis]
MCCGCGNFCFSYCLLTCKGCCINVSWSFRCVDSVCCCLSGIFYGLDC